jgi:serine phosphatase RsbU (regulator of sigma subunit)
VVKKFIADGPDALIERIMEIMRHFRGPQPPNDDSTIVVMAVD